VSISDADARFNLACLPADEYPSLVEPENVATVEMDGTILKDMISNTIYSVALEEAGFKLSGVFTEVITQKDHSLLRMVSTDGHRLSRIDRDIKEAEVLKMNGGIMIPKKGILELSKLASEGGPIKVGFERNNCVVRRENILIVIRLLESQFPDYNAVIPEKMKHVIPINRTALLDGMKKMVILSNESYKGVRMTLYEDNLELVSINPDLGDAQENLRVEYKGESLELGFNARYFIDVLQVMGSDVVELGVIDNSSPCVITGKNDKGFLGLIMPMRL
jgi:DNA polymerase-3 subunit beta